MLNQTNGANNHYGDDTLLRDILCPHGRVPPRWQLLCEGKETISPTACASNSTVYEYFLSSRLSTHYSQRASEIGSVVKSIRHHMLLEILKGSYTDHGERAIIHRTNGHLRVASKGCSGTLCSAQNCAVLWTFWDFKFFDTVELESVNRRGNWHTDKLSECRTCWHPCILDASQKVPAVHA